MILAIKKTKNKNTILLLLTYTHSKDTDYLLDIEFATSCHIYRNLRALSFPCKALPRHRPLTPEDSKRRQGVQTLLASPFLPSKEKAPPKQPQQQQFPTKAKFSSALRRKQ